MFEPLSLWITAHLSAIAVHNLRPPLRSIGMLVVLGLLTTAYILKPFSYDLIQYLYYFEDPQNDFEPIFAAFASALMLVTGENAILALILLELLSMLLAVVVIYTVLRKPDGAPVSLIATAIITASTLFFFLGSQNVIRQFVATLLVAIAIHSLFCRKWLQLVFYAALAIGFHKSALLSLLICFLAYACLRQRYVLKVFLFGALGMLLTAALPFITEGEGYSDRSIDWGDIRTSALTKLFIYAAICVATHAPIARLLRRESIEFRLILSVRISFLAFTAPLAFFGYDEAFTRVLFPYFLFEAILLAKCFFLRPTNLSNLVIIVLLCSYAFAPNVANIFAGED